VINEVFSYLLHFCEFASTLIVAVTWGTKLYGRELKYIFTNFCFWPCGMHSAHGLCMSRFFSSFRISCLL